MDGDIVVKVPLVEYIEINEKVRRYDRIMDAIDRRRSDRDPGKEEVRGSGRHVR